MASSDVIVRLRAIGQQAFKAAMDSAATSLDRVGDEGKEADRAVSGVGTSMGKSVGPMRKSIGRLAAWGGAAAAAYKAGQFLKGSVTATGDLAKTTMQLQRATGLEAEEASAWATITKARDLDARKFGMGLTKLSAQMTAARDGSESAAKAMTQLGISQGTLATGDVQGAIMQAADSFEKMQNPALKAALAQKMFGRSGRDLLPLLNSGSGAIQEQLDLADKYGATLSTKGVEGAKDMIAQQREMKIAYAGLQVQLGSALLPTLGSLVSALTAITRVAQPLLRNGPLMTAIIATLTTAFVTLKVATIASTVAALGFNAALLLIPIAVVALIAGLIIAYKKVGWFRDAVNAAFGAIKTAAAAVFNWVKSHWPLLLSILGGPFGALAVLVIKNFDKIKSAASSVVGFIKRTASSIGKIFEGIFSGRFISDIGRDIADWINANTPFGDKISLPGPLPDFTLPALAVGGVMSHSGLALVGERGPELLQLPGGARVTPLPGPTMGPTPAMAGASRSQTTANFWLDRRLLATAVATDTADQAARR